MDTKILILDTTLRDGSQSPGINFTLKDKIFCAKLLEDLGVDILEIAFPASSNTEYEAAVKISKEIQTKTLCCLARTTKRDIEIAIRALDYAKKPRIHIFISTSKIHMDNQLRKDEQEILDNIYDYVSLAKQYIEDVQWSAMDATRSNRDFLKKCITTAIVAGATTINLPDTVGYVVPKEYYDFIQFFVQCFPKTKFSVHCHNDLGLATANALAGILGGAKQVECTINGIGERAGNSSLEEVVMSLKKRSDYYKSYTDVDTKKLFNISKNIECITGYKIQKNKAIVGGSAYSHQSGIHQDGLLKKRETYEIIAPEEVGLRTSTITLGINSGTAAISSILRKYNINFTNEFLTKIYNSFKDICTVEYKNIDEMTLIKIVSKLNDKVVDHIPIYYLNCFSYTKKANAKYVLNVCILCKKKKYFIDITTTKDELYNQIYKSILKLFKIDEGEIIQIRQYHINYAKRNYYETLLESNNYGQIYRGKSSSEDKIEAFLNSCLSLCSQIIALQTINCLSEARKDKIPE